MNLARGSVHFVCLLSESQALHGINDLRALLDSASVELTSYAK